MKKMLMFVLLAVMLLCVAGAAFAHGPYYGKPVYGHGYHYRPRVVYSPPAYVYPRYVTPVVRPYYVPAPVYMPGPVYAPRVYPYPHPYYYYPWR